MYLIPGFEGPFGIQVFEFMDLNFRKIFEGFWVLGFGVWGVEFSGWASVGDNTPGYLCGETYNIQYRTQDCPAINKILRRKLLTTTQLRPQF